MEAEKTIESAPDKPAVLTGRDRTGSILRHWPWLLLSFCAFSLLCLSVAPLTNDWGLFEFLAGMSGKEPIGPSIPRTYIDQQDRRWREMFSPGKEELRRLQYKSAIRLLQGALAEASGFGSDDPRYLQTLNSLADAHLHAGNLRTAEAMLKKLREFYLSLSPTYPRLIHTCLFLSITENALGHYKEAYSYAREGLERMHENGSNTEHPYDFVFELAVADFGLGNEKEATTLVHSGIDLCRQTQKPENVEYDIWLGACTLATQARQTGVRKAALLKACECILSDFIKQAERAGAEPATMRMYLEYGRLLVAEQRLAETWDMLGRCAKARTKEDPTNTIQSLGWLYIELAEHYEKAGQPKEGARARAAADQILKSIKTEPADH